jgi:hypothetical protein
MKQEEREAFADAYANNVAHVGYDQVLAFLEKYYASDDVEYSEDYTSIVDALGMWHEAIKWQLMQQKDHA